jgi:hypothetical protein
MTCSGTALLFFTLPKCIIIYVGFEVLTAVGTKMAVFWVVAPCSLVEVYHRFRGPCCLHHQGGVSRTRGIGLRYRKQSAKVETMTGPVGNRVGIRRDTGANRKEGACHSLARVLWEADSHSAVQEILTFCRTWGLFIIFIRACHWIQSSASHPIF